MRHRKAVAAFVFRVPGVTLHPIKGNFVLLQKVEQLLPKVGVEGGIAVRLAPAAAAPTLRPAFGHAVVNILGIGDNGDAAGLLERGKPESLYLLYRYNLMDSISNESILEYLK